MSVSGLFNLLLIIGAVHGFIFIFATFTLRRKIEKPVLFLNLFVLFLSLNNLQSWLLEREELLAGNPTFNFSTLPWYILIVPMFYSFLIHYLEIERKKRPLIILSIALFLVALIARFVLITKVGDGEISLSVLKKYHAVEDVFALSYSLTLYGASINILRKSKSLYPEILVYDNLKWVQLFLRLGGFVFLFWFLAIALNTFSKTIQAPYSYYPLRLFSSILIYWVAYQGFLKYRLLKDRIKLRRVIKSRYKNESDGIITDIEYTRSGKLTYKKFDAFITTSKLYLNPNLSLELIADELGVGASTLSKAINAEDSSFSDYINNLRVAEAKNILLDKEFNNYTIVAIGLECGFNSKSTFYSSFKKVTSKTPSEYRRINLAK